MSGEHGLRVSVRRSAPAAVRAFARIAALALLGLACAPAAPKPAGPQGVLIWNVDTLRADRLGAYGHERATSPNLDAFAARAHRFDWAFAQAPYTPPSQSSLLTGLYVSRHGVLRGRDRLPEDVETLAELFAAASFRTAAFVDGGWMSRGSGLAQGFATWDDEGGGLERTVPKLLGWLEGVGDSPFFAMLHTYDVHTPYAPPEAFRDRFLGGLEPPTPGFEATSEQMEAARTSMWTGDPRPLPESDLRWAAALYDAEILAMDEAFGRVLDALARTGLGARTAIVVVSDHGEEFGEHGSVLHEFPYATVTRIPLIVRLPGEAEGAVHSTTVEGIDLAPTLAELFGLAFSGDVDGRSLLPIVRGEGERRSFAFGENPWITPGAYLVDGDRHVLYRPGTRVVQSFDYRADPRELRDLAALEPERTTRLATELERLAGATKRRGRARERAELDERAIRQLKELGYL